MLQYRKFKNLNFQKKKYNKSTNNVTFGKNINIRIKNLNIFFDKKLPILF